MTKEEFKNLLAQFDWLYEYSDDPRVYRENAELHDLIYYAMNQRERQGKSDFKDLYNSCNPLTGANEK